MPPRARLKTSWHIPGHYGNRPCNINVGPPGTHLVFVGWMGPSKIRIGKGLRQFFSSVTWRHYHYVAGAFTVKPIVSDVGARHAILLLWLQVRMLPPILVDSHMVERFGCYMGSLSKPGLRMQYKRNPFVLGSWRVFLRYRSVGLGPQ